jgi:predicted DNA-binding transcriptional regulator AlpA
MSILEQQKQEQKRRELEQQKREQNPREQDQLKIRRVSKRARRCTKARLHSSTSATPRKEAGEKPPDKPPLVFLSKQQVLARIPISGPTLWHWSRTGKFPAPRFIGSRTVWIADEVDAWMQTRPTRNYKAAKPGGEAA